MSSQRFQRAMPPDSSTPLSRLRQRAHDLSVAANEDDASEGFPTRAIQILSDTQCLRAVLPTERGGVGLGWSPAATPLLVNLLRAIGGVHLSAARLFEGHVNAFQLLWLFGTSAQREALCTYVKRGELLGVWNAPSPSGELTLGTDKAGQLNLIGSKAYASGAGGIRRPLVTATHAEFGSVMVWPDADYEVGPEEEWSMHGMRSSFTRSVSFRCVVTHEHVFGSDGDYHRQPYFSGGSWRFLAAQLGAAEALAEWMRQELTRRGRASDIHQQIRMAECAVALATAQKWVTDAAHLMSTPHSPVEQLVQHANEARLVVERSVLDVLERVHRGVGLQSFSRLSPIERIARDLATYLRQPAPDALLNAVGEHAFVSPFSGLLAGGYDDE
jgi:alkylation response protein AidB-like acyl-CoA dehydrogenase